MRTKFWLLLAAGMLAVLTAAGGTGGVPAAYAEGSRELVANPSDATDVNGNGGKRAVIEWRADLFANTFTRRTLLQVYLTSGDVMNLGSSAVGISSGDAVV